MSIKESDRELVYRQLEKILEVKSYARVVFYLDKVILLTHLTFSIFDIFIDH
jgi:hypothetical protein